MLSRQELAEERKHEASINKLSETIISKTAWGKFYGLMRSASKFGEGAIPHKVCLDKDGRILKIYKSNAGKWVGTFLKPAHEQMARDLSHHKYGRGMLDMLGFGSFIDHHEMKHAHCFTLTPNAVLKHHAKKIASHKMGYYNKNEHYEGVYY